MNAGQVAVRPTRQNVETSFDASSRRNPGPNPPPAKRRDAGCTTALEIVVGLPPLSRFGGKATKTCSWLGYDVVREAKAVRRRRHVSALVLRREDARPLHAPFHGVGWGAMASLVHVTHCEFKLASLDAGVDAFASAIWGRVEGDSMVLASAA